MGWNGEKMPQYWKNYVTIYFHSDQVETYICTKTDDWQHFFALIPCLRSQAVVLAIPSFPMSHNGDKCNIKAQLSGYKANLHITKPLANIKVIQGIWLSLRAYSTIIHPLGSYHISCFISMTNLQIFPSKIDQFCKVRPTLQYFCSVIFWA